MRKKLTRKEKIDRAVEVRDLVCQAKNRVWELEADLKGSVYTAEAIRKMLDGIEYMSHVLVNEQVDSEDTD